jgi:hypothetical protein
VLVDRKRASAAIPRTTFRSVGYARWELPVPSEAEFTAKDARRAVLVEAIRALVQRAVVDSGLLAGEATWGAEETSNYPGIAAVERIDVRFTVNDAGLAALRTACRRLDHLVAESLRNGDLSDATFANTSARLYDDDGRAVHVVVVVGC